MILFRDYGLYDLAQLRFGSGHTLGGDSYLKTDGTFVHYFSLETLEDLFADFLIEEMKYCTSKIVNAIKKNGPQHRVWIHAKFKKKQSREDSQNIKKRKSEQTME